MKPFTATLCLLLYLVSGLSAQTTYRGSIGAYPVELAMEIYSDGLATAIYAYDKIDEPIRLSGRLAGGTLLLKEATFEAADTTVLSFPAYVDGSDSLTGTWTNDRMGRHLTIRLAKVFSLSEPATGNQEILQDESLNDFYFRQVLSGTGDNVRVSGLKIFRKGTDVQLQELSMDCEFMGLSGTTTGDYNFDGYPDISVYEGSYAGANTSSLYFLYDPVKKNFYKSGFTGVSLQFDPVKKRITEVNSCCAGTSVIHTVYKVVRNEMVQTEAHCYKWSDVRGELVERPLKECN